MPDLNLKAIENDLSFLARVVQSLDLGALEPRDRARLFVLATRYPRGGTHVAGDFECSSDDDAGTRSR